MMQQIALEELYQYDSLEFMAKQVVEGFIIGLHKSPYHGFSVEFAEHRLYNSGESTKYMDWKVFARTDKKFIKRFEEETNLRCRIILDTSSSMYFPEETPGKLPVSKIRFSVVAAAALMRLFKNQRDAVGLSLFADKVDTHTPAKTSQIHHNYLMSQLEDVLAAEPKQQKTDAINSIHEIAESIHKRSLVVIFSDMFDQMSSWDPEDGRLHEIFSALQHLRYNKHEVVLFHVMDKAKELDFEFENRPYEFVDIESGEKVKLQPNEVKAHYVQQMKQFEEELRLKCGQYQIDFVTADVNKGFDQVLTPYLVKRSKMF
jgi:uncharacterized protein (DUF58 family)